MCNYIVPMLALSLVVELTVITEHEPQKHIDLPDFSTPYAVGYGAIVMQSTTTSSPINLMALYQGTGW